MEKKIKIGMDFHGVITANPDFFKKFNRLAIEKGLEVYVLSGGHRLDIKNYLVEKGIAYSFIWSMLDYYDLKCEVSYFPDGSFKVDDDLWNTAKGDYCLRNKIDFHIDDSSLYGEHFKTIYCQYDVSKQECVTGKHREVVVDFNQSPDKVLQDILDIISRLRKAKI